VTRDPHTVLDEINDQKRKLRTAVNEAKAAVDVQANKGSYWVNRVDAARSALDEALAGQAAHAAKLADAQAVAAIAVQQLDEYVKHVEVLVGPIRELLASGESQ
jgi:hypothetical protein